MNIRKLICWLKGHDYKLIEVEHHHPRHNVYLYQCTRCGRRTKYRSYAEAFADSLIMSKAEEVMKKEVGNENEIRQSPVS